MKGCLGSWVPIDVERFIYMGNGNKALVEAIALFRLQLEYGCYLDLDETFYVTSFGWNLVSISCLDKSGYFCSFGNGKISYFSFNIQIWLV